MNSLGSMAWRVARFPLLLIAVLSLSACATLLADIDPPKVSVDSVRSLPNAEGGPRFEITLRIANPNKQALNITGISYAVDLLGRELVSGVSNDIPRIAAYSEQKVKLEAGVNLLQVLRLITELGQTSTDNLDYRFSAKIDFAGLMPTLRVSEKGSLSLN